MIAHKAKGAIIQTNPVKGGTEGEREERPKTILALSILLIPSARIVFAY
jgi:hypothetical protein